MNTTAVAFHAVTFRFDPTSHFTFDVRLKHGTISAIMGPSGAGKSTFLSLLAGFERPLSGHIEINGMAMGATPPSHRPVSMVFQDNNLFAHLTVMENVALGITASAKLDASQRDRCLRAMERTGLTGLSDRLPAQLSGGQRQRVALARVLVRDRPLLLLDEAFASLGPALRNEMLDLVAQLHRENGLTTLMVTHFPEDARRIADQIAFIDNGSIALITDMNAAFDGSADNPAWQRYICGERNDPSGK